MDPSIELLPEQFQINPSLPIYEQFVEAIQGRIVSGLIPPGSRLPSVRELAAGRGLIRLPPPEPIRSWRGWG